MQHHNNTSFVQRGNFVRGRGIFRGIHVTGASAVGSAASKFNIRSDEVGLHYTSNY